MSDSSPETQGPKDASTTTQESKETNPVATNSNDDQAGKPAKTLRFSYFEPIAGMIFSILCAVIFLWFSEIITIVFVGGRLIPTFDETVIQSMWFLVILWGLLRIAVDISYLVERCYTKRLAIISIVGNTLTAIVGCILLIPHRIVYWEYIDFVHEYFEETAAWFGSIAASPNLIILVVMVIVLALETITAVRKGWKNDARKKTDSDDDSADSDNTPAKKTSA